MTESADDIWGDDLLGRREFADFLTNALVARTELISAKEGQRGWTVALDAAWGAGKSFFINHWADDLRRQGYPVVLFDAWENDIGEESSVALMAEINEEMKQWIGKLPKTKTMERKARALVADAGRKLRKSVMPVAKVVASGMLQKAIGVGLQEVLDSSGKAADGESNDKTSLASSAEEVLDKVFDVSIQEHQRRKSDIRDFKKALVDLIDLIHEQASAKYPLFVFIDELDRCRPTYAISMLEEVKHIFGMDKVCFVVSTNLSQLRHSICAVYGQGFNSEMYLKRFFDQSIELPQEVSIDHLEELYDFYEVLSSKEHFLPLRGLAKNKKQLVLQGVAWVFRACGIDARSQRQVFQIADSAAASIEQPVHTIFLFLLCAMIHKDRVLFDELEGGGDAGKICKEFLSGDGFVSYVTGKDFGFSRLSYKLSDAFIRYVELSKRSWDTIKKHGYNESIESIQSLIDTEMVMQAYRRENDVPGTLCSISRYFKLVRYAGYLE